MKRKLNLKRVMGMLLAVLLVLGCVPSAFAADAPTVTLTADKTEVLKGETITLTLSIDKEWEDAYLWQWNIVWDSTYFDATAKTSGPAYKYTAVNLNATTYYDAPYKAASVATGKLDIHDVKAGVIATVTLTAKQDITGENQAKIYVDQINTESGEEYQNADGEWVIKGVATTINNATGENAPINVTVMEEAPVVKYNVTLGEDLAGEATVEEGQDYTFTLTEAEGYDYELSATMGGEKVEITENEGTYTITKVAGDIVVTVKKTAKQFGVTLGEDMTGADTATFGEDYSATLVRAEGFTYEIGLTIGGEAAEYAVENDVYAVDGDDILGDIVFTVEKTEILPEEYTVTFEGTGAADISGEAKAVEKADYTFTVEKAEGYDYTVSATMNGKAVEFEGEYTIKAVNGDIVITVEKTAKVYDVTFEGTGKDDAAGAENATYGEDYTFTVEKAEGYDYTVSATMNGQSVELAGEYTIADVTGDIVITIEKTEILPEEYTVTFEGTGAADAAGEAKATEKEDYTFTVTKEDGYDYTVSATMNGQAVALTGEYTIADVTGDIVITVEKTAKVYDVTLGTDMSGEETATHGESYTAKLTKEEGYEYVVTATMGGAPVDFTEDKGTYVIDDVDGNIVFTVTKTEIVVVPEEYEVTFAGSGKDDAQGDAVVTEGEDYTFTLTKDEGYDYTVSATMGNAKGELTEENDTYTIREADGNIIITITKEAKVYDVTLGTDMSGEETATHGGSYTAKLTKAEGYEYTVTATMGGEAVELAENNGEYTIADVTGDIVFTVTKTPVEDGGDEPGDVTNPDKPTDPETPADKDDTQDNENEAPATGDNAVVYMVFGMMAAAVVVINKKRRIAE